MAIIKVNGTNEILGGYNPLNWTTNYWGGCRIIDVDCAIRCNSDYGPIFTNNFMMTDNSKTWKYIHDDAFYEKRLRSDNENLFN
ncbi:hypothetical protein C2G38_2166086 [Gigaspora rosea]|uniref:TLDc domain-containing protein n=1 Tax=Gigaspora rosea TaxID=44941 RepID=A0A397VS34_9GLOM|nr:hypothetical protein C2G38_2166086 [Gigaspora rosea]